MRARLGCRKSHHHAEDTMFRYILVPATGTGNDPSVFATALVVARLSAAHLKFLHVRPDDQQALVALTASADLGGGVNDYSAIDALNRHAADRCGAAEQAFRAFCEREQLTVPGHPALDRPSAEWQLEVGDQRSCWVEHAAEADLVVVGRGHEIVLEASLMATGRPVLIAPAEAPKRLSGTIAIAWKNCPEAARAVTAARPFIKNAEQVIIFSAEEGMELGQQSAERLRDALAWHNPNTTLRHLQPGSHPPVETCSRRSKPRRLICW
jgi:nucleotide-binding universal stress UspA family protein